MSSWYKPEGDGLYVINLNTSIPEFPFTIPIMLVGMVLTIAFYRMKFRK